VATCGQCQREIIWACLSNAHSSIALDKVEGLDGSTYTLDHPGGGQRPVATPVRRPGVFPGHRLHSETCGVGTIR
jgi:hypothetical protein